MHKKMPLQLYILCRYFLIVVKSVHLHLRNVFQISVVVRAVASQSRSPGLKTSGWLQI